MRVQIRVRPPRKGEKTYLSSRDATPYAAILGRIGNSWVARELSAAQLEVLSQSGLFEFRSDMPGEKARVVRLVERDNTRNVVKLTA